MSSTRGSLGLVTLARQNFHGPPSEVRPDSLSFFCGGGGFPFGFVEVNRHAVASFEDEGEGVLGRDGFRFHVHLRHGFNGRVVAADHRRVGLASCKEIQWQGDL